MKFKILILSVAVTIASHADELKLHRTATDIVIDAAESSSKSSRQLLTYNAVPGQRPYLHPVMDASGKHVLTQDRPDDHPWQHGIFTGFHGINGFNYWKEDQGRQRLVRVSDIRTADDRVSWKSLIELVDPEGSIVLEEENEVTIHALESTNSYLIDFSLTLRAKEKDVHFGKFYVGGLSVRMPWDKSNPRQTHLNSNGLIGRAGEQKRAAWCTVERPFHNETHGIAIFDHPTNSNHPPVWRVDEQGLINPNISGLTDWSLSSGQAKQFHYRILVYRGAANKDQLEAHFRKFSATHPAAK